MTARLPRAFMCLCALLVGADAFAAGAVCDRPCLRGMLDQYLNAVVKHDSGAAPLAVAFRQTENAIVVRPGMGVWKTITGLGAVQRRYLDAVSGQAGYFGVVDESGAAAVTTLRLKIEDRKIAEAEWVIARKDAYGPNGPGGALVNPDSLIANPPPERTVPKGARPSRETMTAIANSYFDGLSTHDGAIIMHEPGCVRVENGTVMGRGGRGPSGDCASNLENLNVSLVAARRYPIVDEEAGVVLGMVVFMRKPGTATRRNLLTEWFFVDDNRIKTIYAAMFYPPPEQPVPNWPPYDGNWPLSATIAPGPASTPPGGSAPSSPGGQPGRQ
jgi:hypothetical protein